MNRPPRIVLVLLAVAFGATGARAEDFTTALQSRIGVIAATAAGTIDARERQALQKFYAEREYQPIWIGAQGPNERARATLQVLSGAAEDGLEPSDYGVARLGALMKAGTAQDRAELEGLLSLATVTYAGDLASGRLAPEQVDPENYVYPRDIDPMKVLGDLASSDYPREVLKHYTPDTPEYIRLKTALADYRKLAEVGGWSPIPEGPTLKPGMTDPRVPALRGRLTITGDLSGESLPLHGAEPLLFDEALVAAVRRFQWRHGLDIDGAIGKQTLEELNIPVERRIDQILTNMERRRWMPDDPGEMYLFVNLTDFLLKAVKGGKTIYTTRVVVGAPYTRTPVFTGRMTYIQINPYWTVPPSIAGKEILRAVQRNPDYLRKHNFTVFSDWSAGASVVDPASIDWASLRPGRFPYKLRQGPGPGNSLGRIAFMLPNKFNVYLHDTPAKALFERSSRGFSHGCIRVQYPARLAEIIFREFQGDPRWTPEAIQAAIDTDENKIVPLARPFPVHLAYITAFANKDGSVHFRRDVYGRDRKLIALLAGNRPAGE